MANTKVGNTKPYIDPIEKNDNEGFFDQLFAKSRSSERSTTPFAQNVEKPKPRIRQEFNIFKRIDREENELRSKKIEQLQDTIRQELADLKKSGQSFVAEVNNIENQTLTSAHEQAGEYHVHFLETLLSMLRLLRVKVNEAGSWLQAIQTKKAKRGSMGSTHKQNEERRAQTNAH